MKQTIEEAVLNIIPDKSTAGWKDCFGAYEREGFIKGAEWMQQQMKQTAAIKRNIEKILSQVHTKITRRKGKDYAPTSNEIQKEIDAVSSQTEMSNESWEGCDGCTEQDEIMYKNGYAKGYNAAIAELPKEISDKEITKLASEHILYNDSKRQWVIEGMKLYREQLKD